MELNWKKASVNDAGLLFTKSVDINEGMTTWIDA
jgi:hypothetical protein